MKQLHQNPAIYALCEVPMCFVVLTHMSDDDTARENLNSVTGLFSYMKNAIVCHQRNKCTSEKSRTESFNQRMELAELAFNGLCSGKVVWEDDELVDISAETREMYTDLGILVKEHATTTTSLPGMNQHFETIRKDFFRFFQEAFQELYAAYYIVHLTERESDEVVKGALNRLNPIDFQYVFRFACGLHPAAAKIVLYHIKELKQDLKMFSSLCVMETGADNSNMSTLTELCRQTITLSGLDTLLERATREVLEIASQHQIQIASLKLSSCYESVDETSLRLYTGLKIPITDNLNELIVYGCDCRQTVVGLLGLVLRLSSLKTLCFERCKLPKCIDDRRILQNLQSRRCEVKWKNSSGNLEFCLNFSNGNWEMDDFPDDDLTMTEGQYKRMPLSYAEELENLNLTSKKEYWEFPSRPEVEVPPLWERDGK